MEDKNTNSNALTTAELLEFIKSQDILDVLIKCNAVDENDVVGRKICCPFHDDKTPSLMFYESNFYCFGCSANGDAVTYIQKIFDLSFIQALGLIADSYNKKLVSGSFNPFIDNKVSVSRLESEWQGYLENMKNAPERVKEGAKLFFPLEVGYDPKISYYVFRFTSKTNMTLGFTKRRAFETENKTKYPKWKHSSIENSRIAECASMYNLGSAISHIRRTSHVVLVEGPKDVIPWIMSGTKEVVAISGTHHINKVMETLPVIDTFTLSLDSDEAGIKGMRDITKFLSNSVELEKIRYMDYNGLDPYDYWSKYNSLPKSDKPIVELFDDPTIKELYQSSSEFNKDYLITYKANRDSLSYSEAESFFKMTGNNNKEIHRKQESEIDRLVKSSDPKALRKMQLKYGIE